ncbi:LamG-like jellyroll fold domain-containing protein [Methylocapsa sp. S129]|uniref:LamG-like jellyroll fold domain-containing protein n=1 Tax=Methylocapsa sp. S129 TaxID=1641869 RepID=UPI00131C0BC6|nr:LamG-like jellyroll fold domain-containing protein [Methylocapsa sp. S129]
MYSTTIVNATAQTVVANTIAISAGEEAAIAYTPTGVVITVHGAGVVHLNDNGTTAVWVASGSERQSFTTETIKVTVRSDATILIEPNPGAAAEMPILDDPMDYALTCAPLDVGRIISVSAAQHTFATGDFTLTLLFQFVAGPRGFATDTALLRRIDGAGCGLELLVQGYRIIDFVNLYFALYDAETQVTYSAKAPEIYNGRWHALAVVRSGANVSLFLNCKPLAGVVRRGPESPVNLATLAPLFIGSYRQVLANGETETGDAHGLIEDVTLWGRALSPTEIISTMTNQLSGAESGLVGLYAFNQNLADSSPSAATLACAGPAAAYDRIIHSFAVHGENDHSLLAMSAPTRYRATSPAAADDDPPLSRVQTLNVREGAPFLYGALIKDDGTAAFPDGVTLVVSSPNGPVNAARDDASAWVTMSGASVRAFVFKAPPAGEWTFTVTAPAGLGFQLAVQTMPSANVAQTLLTTVRAAYPGLSNAAGRAAGLKADAADDDWEWWEIGLAALGTVALAAVAIAAAPVVLAAAAAATTAQLVGAAVGVGITGVAAASYISSMTPDPGIVPGAQKTIDYARFDPRPSVTVFIWSYVSFDRGQGHASMSLSDETYISWWPKGIATIWNLNGVAQDFYADHVIDRTYSDDITGEGDPNFNPPTIFRDPDYRIKIFGLDEAAIKTWWANQQLTENYRLIDMNCSTVVYKALCAGGALDKLTVEDRTYWTDPVRLVWHPNIMERFARLLSARTGG